MNMVLMSSTDTTYLSSYTNLCYTLQSKNAPDLLFVTSLRFHEPRVHCWAQPRRTVDTCLIIQRMLCKVVSQPPASAQFVQYIRISSCIFLWQLKLQQLRLVSVQAKKIFWILKMNNWWLGSVLSSSDFGIKNEKQTGIFLLKGDLEKHSLSFNYNLPPFNQKMILWHKIANFD